MVERADEKVSYFRQTVGAPLGLFLWSHCRSIPEVFAKFAEPDSPITQGGVFTYANTKPEWFVEAVEAVQRYVYGLEGLSADSREVDGWFGPSTLRRVNLLVQSPSIPEPLVGLVRIGLETVSVPGVKIVHPEDPGGMSLCRNGGRMGDWSNPLTLKRVNRLAVLHWDVCTSSASCFRALISQGYSSTFGVDNEKPDGSVRVFQWLDPGQNYGIHAGEANKSSLLSFDLSNAVAPKYQGRYEVKRPVLTARPHGDRKVFLGMQRGQILATLRILAAVSREFPRFCLRFPVQNRRPVETLAKTPEGGVCTHLHLSRNKWDISGFEHQVVGLLRGDTALAQEFPTLAEDFAIYDSGWSAVLSGMGVE